ncbi:hypothetical protein [Sinorhizobium medicae]|uniref:hypothetical protein n=1 Tax=Sinorhizobium medicae TaxID=110321 RepID=UPI00041D2F46|nr:hypothetical protein [Sinorhizobium medicae]RVQ76121.1 hypothetical protein CN244_06330 [Sinorhizobium medicae]
MQAKERMFLNADKTKLVKDGDKTAAFLYAVPGDEIPASAAEKFGLVDGRLKGSGKAASDEALRKQADEEEAKARTEAEAEAGAKAEKAKAEDEARLSAEKEKKAGAADKEAKAATADKEAKSGGSKGK